MSDKLVSYEAVINIASDMVFSCHDEREEFEKRLNELSVVPQPMTAAEYIKQQFRMCMAQSDGVKCEGCPLSPSVTGEYCDTYEVLHPEEAVAIVEKWAREHPDERRSEK